MALSDKTLVCVDCGNEFIFTVGEQEFFNSRGFVNDPKRCQTCRSSRRAEQRGDRPVYCSDCFSRNRNTMSRF